MKFCWWVPTVEIGYSGFTSATMLAKPTHVCKNSDIEKLSMWARIHAAGNLTAKLNAALSDAFEIAIDDVEYWVNYENKIKIRSYTLEKTVTHYLESTAFKQFINSKS